MFTIRKYRNEDCNQITDIYAHHVTYGTGSFETAPPTIEEMATRLGDISDAGYPIYVAVTQENIICGYGYGSAHKQRFGYRYTVEDSLYVHPDYLQQGIGTALLDRLIQSCTEKGFHQMIAVIGDSENLGSRLTHEKSGFRLIGIAHHMGLKFNRFLDVVYMQKMLCPEDAILQQIQSENIKNAEMLKKPPNS